VRKLVTLARLEIASDTPRAVVDGVLILFACVQFRSLLSHFAHALHTQAIRCYQPTTTGQ